ncbi:MAG: hypothetical protein HC896_06310, partial [Bacteroidales bacterium]|nr:hypothetical protein [Bacteroidales bacterium]
MGDYLLHPSLMDSALQSSIGLFEDVNKLEPQPSLPFALDTLLAVSPCKKEMFAWVRYSQGSKPGDRLEKLDVDLYDTEGNVCVQMKGYSSRTLVSETNLAKTQNGQPGTVLATPVWQPTESEASTEKAITVAQHHIILTELSQVKPKQLEPLLLNSTCHVLQVAPKEENLADSFIKCALACFGQVHR